MPQNGLYMGAAKHGQKGAFIPNKSQFSGFDPHLFPFRSFSFGFSGYLQIFLGIPESRWLFCAWMSESR
jgi:hypothetical protein